MFRLFTCILLPFIGSSDNKIAVNVTLFYETLCPDCTRFYREQLTSHWIDRVVSTGQIVLNLLPYGNAKAWNDCQHGKKECDGNMLEACAIHYIHDVNKYLPVIRCMELQFESKVEAVKSLEKCYSDDEIIADILKCYGDGEGVEGIQLIEDIAKRTTPHHGVPWVIINGNPRPKAEFNLKITICEEEPTIEGCSSLMEQLEQIHYA